MSTTVFRCVAVFRLAEITLRTNYNPFLAKNGIVPCVNTWSALCVNNPSHINTDITCKSYTVQNTGICEFWDYDIGVVERYVFSGIWRSVAGWATRIELHAVCLRNRGSIPGKVNSFYTYVRMTNEMHTFSHYFIPIGLSSTCFEQIIVHHQEVTSVHAAYSIYHASMGCPAANTMW